MSASVTSRVRSGKVAGAQPPDNSPVDLVLADNALLSLRASGHDYCSAVGEVFDNSIQANANNIRLVLFTDKKIIGSNSKRTEVVESVAIGDDGDGMAATVLHRALQFGFSSRYDDRGGMGRFGVGAKLAGISVARRLEIWSRQSVKSPWLFTYIDLDEIESGSLRYIPAPVAADLPEHCRGLVGDRGTLVVWSKTDRMQSGKQAGPSVPRRSIPTSSATPRRRSGSSWTPASASSSTTGSSNRTTPVPDEHDAVSRRAQP